MIENKTPEIGKEETVEEAIKAYIEKEGFTDSMDKMYLASAIRFGTDWQSQTTYTKQEVIDIIERVKERCAEAAGYSPSKRQITDIDFKYLLK